MPPGADLPTASPSLSPRTSGTLGGERTLSVPGYARTRAGVSHGATAPLQAGGAGGLGPPAEAGTPLASAGGQRKGAAALKTARSPWVRWVHLRSPTGNKPPPQPRPSVLTHHLTGDRWRPGAPPAGRPTAWPVARLPAAWPGSGAPSDTAAPRRWSGRTRSRVHSKCKGGSNISRGPTDRHPEKAGRARSQRAVLRPLGRQRGEGSAAAGPPLMASSGVLGTADLARPRGASKGGEPASRPPHCCPPPTSELPMEVLRLPRAQGRVLSQSGFSEI